MLLRHRMILATALTVGVLGWAVPSASASSTASTSLVKVGVPVITSSPASIGYGGSFVIGTPNAPDVAVAFLVPFGSPIPFPVPPHPQFGLSILSSGARSVTVAGPSSTGAVPPGRYLLAIAVHDLTGLLGSIGVPIDVLGAPTAPPSPSPSPKPHPSATVAGGGDGASSGTKGASGASAPSGGHSSGKGSGGSNQTSGPRPLTAGKGAARADRSPLHASKADDRSPLARFPWLLIVLVALFGMTARRLARLS